MGLSSSKVEKTDFTSKKFRAKFYKSVAPITYLIKLNDTNKYLRVADKLIVEFKDGKTTLYPMRFIIRRYDNGTYMFECFALLEQYLAIDTTAKELYLSHKKTFLAVKELSFEPYSHIILSLNDCPEIVLCLEYYEEYI